MVPQGVFESFRKALRDNESLGDYRKTLFQNELRPEMMRVGVPDGTKRSRG